MRGAARIRRMLRRVKGRMSRPGALAAPATALEDSLLDSFHRGGRPQPAALREAFRFFHDDARLKAIAARPEADLGLSAMAEAYLAGELPYFERSHPWGTQKGISHKADWLTVPGGGRWQMLPASSYHHGDFTRWGDIRLLWELGRLQAAPPLAAAARIADNPEFANAALDLLAEFRRSNPVGWGPQWIAGLEGGLRIFSLLWTWALLPDLDDEATLLLTASLLENGRFVESKLSLKDIANNHLIGESAALYVLGHALPVFMDSARWRDRGHALLERELDAQVLSDGVQGEQAIEYHRFVLEFYMQAGLWGRAAGEDIFARWGDKLAAMFRPLAALTGPDGRIVSIGDDDGGRVLRLDDRSRRDARGLLGLGSRLLNVADTWPLDSDVSGESVWLLGPDAAERERAGGALPEFESFGESGWISSRFGECNGVEGLHGSHLVFKAGPMGRGGAGHSHADQLSLTLSLDGKPLLVDPGSYLYNGPQSWRDHFRGARAHSMLRVGDRDPAEPFEAPDRFGWARKASANAEAVHVGEQCRFMQARRQGDRDAAGNAIEVGRRILQIPPGIILVIDEVIGERQGTEPLPVESLWQCAPGIEAHWQPAAETEIEGPQGRGSGGYSTLKQTVFHALRLKRGERSALIAHFYAPVGVYPFLKEGESRPPAGWVSEDYGQKEAAALTGLGGRVAGPILIATLLADPNSYPRLERSSLDRGLGGELRMEIARELDEVIRVCFRPLDAELRPMDDWIDDLEITAPFAFAVLGPSERLKTLVSISPERIRYKGRDLLEGDETEPLFEKEW